MVTAIEEFDGGALFSRSLMPLLFQAAACEQLLKPAVILPGILLLRLLLWKSDRENACIPTIFVSYTGESLDYKAPLLKALEALIKPQ